MRVVGEVAVPSAVLDMRARELVRIMKITDSPTFHVRLIEDGNKHLVRVFDAHNNVVMKELLVLE